MKTMMFGIAALSLSGFLVGCATDDGTDQAGLTGTETAQEGRLAPREVRPPGAPLWGKLYSLATTPANCVKGCAAFGAGGNPGACVGDAEIDGCFDSDEEQWQYNLDHHTLGKGWNWLAGAWLCLGSFGTSPGSPVETEVCDDTGTQIWRIQGQGLYNPATNMCLDDAAYGGWGTRLILWPCNGQTNQMWNIVGYSQ